MSDGVLNPWMPIETAPKDGTFVDLWGGGIRLADCAWRYGGWGFIPELTNGEGWFKLHVVPSHWMPIPPPAAPLRGPAFIEDDGTVRPLKKSDIGHMP